ncbi:HAD-IIA family hydrolase [Micrococcus terreus]|uniref:HAD-IIA family hydrolase n=1 Tax=Micrococcus terreus TaxID=574650 RepID=UPI0021A5C858|nr:HAD-IIA family hydrolase [Micrococcus terreus]MCT2090143.1 HAD-IIA family hydrolase [Micrococcus terreus]
MEASFFSGHDALLCDLDGVVYAGAGAIAGAVETLHELTERGVPVAFVTNNASRSPQSVAEHLAELGITATAEQIFGAAAAGVRLLEGMELPPGSAVLVIGSDYLRGLVSEAGFRVVSRADEQPAAVIQGFDPSVGWADLAQAAYAIQAGAVWVATNTDLTIPRAEGIAPGNGSLVQAVSQATGVIPPAAGKPQPLLFQWAAEQLGAQRPLVVGDRLDTDILGGNRAGFTTALVLTGVDSRESAAAAPQDQRPQVIVQSLDELLGERS